jgi:hypothetical protein
MGLSFLLLSMLTVVYWVFPVVGTQNPRGHHADYLGYLRF